MRFQIYLSLCTILQACVVLPALAFPLRYPTDTSELELTRHTKDPTFFRPDTHARTLDTLEKRAHNSELHATVAYVHTKNKPHKQDTFHAVNGNTFTGAEVHRAIKAFHQHDPVPNNHQHGSAGAIARQPKPFRNDPNSNGHSPYPYVYNQHNPRPARPAGLYEFPLVKGNGAYHGGNPGAARIIMHKNHDGSHHFVGVVSHPPHHATSVNPYDHYRAQHVPHHR